MSILKLSLLHACIWNIGNLFVKPSAWAGNPAKWGAAIEMKRLLARRRKK